MITPDPHASLGERILRPETLWDRVVRWGIFSVSLGAIAWFAMAAVRYIVWPLRVIFAPLALALILVYFLGPIVNRLQRSGMRRGLAVALVYLGFLVVLAGALTLAVPVVARQIADLVANLPGYAADATREINEFAARRRWTSRVDLSSEQVQRYVVENRDAIVGVLGGVRTFAFGVIHALVAFVVGTFLSIYMLLDMPKIQKAARDLVPAHRRDELFDLGGRMAATLGAFFRGQLLVALFVGVASGIGLSLVKIPFAAVVGVVAGVFNLVPLIGPFIGAIPAVILGLLSGEPIRALWAAIVLLVVQQVDNHVISPNVMGRSVKLHPITVMLALLAAGSLYGIIGMLLVIPAIAVVKEIVKYLWEKRRVRDAVAEALPDGMSESLADGPPPGLAGDEPGIHVTSE